MRKIAIIHDWLVTYAGAERVLEEILNIYPHADIFSIVDFLPPNERFFLKGKKVFTSFIAKLPFARRAYRHYLFLMPLAVEQFDLSSYDLIISSSHAVAKGVLVGPNQLHVTYCHTPIRYAWDLQHQYLKESGFDTGFMGWVVRLLLHKIRLWDIRTSNGVDFFIANSKYISKRILKVYRRESTVIYPPVNTNAFTFEAIKKDFYVTASRMVPYKKVSLIVEAFSKMQDKTLYVIGTGPDYEKCVSLGGSNIIFLGWQPHEIFKQYLQNAKAFVFAAEEDFGIAPLEAQACGTPVIAFGRGGALETVVPFPDPASTGIFFQNQDIESIIDAVNLFENNINEISPVSCRLNAEKFSVENFQLKFKTFIENTYKLFFSP